MSSFITLTNDVEEKLLINVNHITKVYFLKTMINIHIVDQPRPVSVVYSEERWNNIVTMIQDKDTKSLLHVINSNIIEVETAIHEASRR
jgi:hypothetical protein